VVANVITVTMATAVIFTDPGRPMYGEYRECLGNAFYLAIAWGVFLGCGGCVQVYRLWRNKDAYYMKSEFRTYAIAFVLFVIGFVVNGFYPTRYDITVVVTFLAGFAGCLISLYFPIAMSYKAEWRRRAASETSSKEGSINLDGNHHMNAKELFRYCLDTPALLAEFKEYCVELWCSENIQFYLEVQEFKKSVEEGRGVDKARELVETFVNPKTAMSLINIDFTTSQAIEAKLETGDITVSLFDDAEHTVLQQMSLDTFHKFRASGRLAEAWARAGFGNISETVEDSEAAKKKKTDRDPETPGDPGLSPTAMELLISSSSAREDKTEAVE